MTKQHHQGGEGVPPPSQSPATQPGDPGADALPPDPAPGIYHDDWKHKEGWGGD